MSAPMNTKRPDVHTKKTMDIKNNFLTLDQVRDSIYKQCKIVMESPPRLWGFRREVVVEYLKRALKEMEEKCQKN